jgi:hypothetical protein
MQNEIQNAKVGMQNALKEVWNAAAEDSLSSLLLHSDF